MKIASITVFPLTSERPELKVGKPIHPPWWGYDQALVRVDTDEGLFGWNTAVGLAADLQLAASKPDAPYVDGILVEPFRLDDDGMLSTPDRPGRGIELDMDAVRARGEGAAEWGE